MRMTEGDHIQITLINSKDSKHDHSIHMHSIHSGSMDGVPGTSGDSGQVHRQAHIHSILLPSHLEFIHIIVM